ncbi:sensor domain-containing diguanylate cyclase [Actinoplanes sp. RD1]|uniref:sensor domain-containing diguanylate cyclase n=1 Tax=Actinoplanes sp. RD1 TaxID=3064538 RepID=UPI0027413165|nr:sensor domain-containing diguanylate cyclase [Actinoplanes sp. RD1]
MRLMQAFARDGMESLLALVAVVVLHQFGLAGDVPLWHLLVLLGLGVVVQQRPVQRFLAGHDPNGRLELRIAIHTAIWTAAMYLTGWGAVLAILHVHIRTQFLRKAGSAAWQPSAVASAAAIVAGQLAVAFGLVGSYLPVGLSHVVALLVLIISVTTARSLGQFVAQGERSEAAARLSEDRFRALVRDGSEVITMSDAKGAVSWVSPAALPVMGYKPEELHGQVLRGLYHPEDEVAAMELFTRLLASDSTVEHSAELRVRHADGTFYWHEIISRNMLAHPAVHAIVSHQRDITERRAAQDRIAYAASHDSLTGLANGPTLKRDLERALAQGTRYQHAVAMLFCDLDGFKSVNDTYGHDVGDRLLQTISGVIKRTTRDTDSAGRLGGDEFGVVLTRVRNAEEALNVAQRLIEGIAGNAAVAGLKLDVGCSVGVAIAYPGGTDAKTLMRKADAAMYRSKRNGRNGAVVYLEEETPAPWM